jgi:hypothetical protein
MMFGSVHHSAPASRGFGFLLDGFLARLQFIQHLIQAFKLPLKGTPIAFEPAIDLLKGLRPEGVDSALGVWTDFD